MTNLLLLTGFMVTGGFALLLPQYAVMLFAVLAFVFGIPHGALDLWIMRRLWHTSLKTWLLSGIAYVILAGAVLIGFYTFPTAMLLVFLAYSAFHFGMDYYPEEAVNTSLIASLHACLCGAGLIAFPALFYGREVLELFLLITNREGALKVSASLHALAILLIPVFPYLLWKQSPSKRKELLLAVGGALIAPPIAFLTIYFVGIHSRNHFLLLYKKMGYQSPVAFVKAVIPMTLLSYLIAAGIFLSLIPELSFQDKAFASAIYTLAALALPHLVVVECLKRHGIRTALSTCTPHP
ncbi:Beta-carotene 15,15'-dioxygenase [Legionella geestiana]|uniref:Probable beta-carotene 15,15'-dioxygenase n=1 Tax=Legionella geestiana TaxID=45065 RepID=A0A0W0TPH5_9GAMM|nr:Brp/Blh family beta-carotene 15,15'-dioxygenase [Legionella geestiana]KTC97487.1 Beta-carotene 15,15'-dioxygenase [Legionella geestiana]QBS13308.1 hypothetical protein E4T54_11430 [Legionella geestiana]QDQ40901.1 hypothetical protein E3226_011055 [Legionella geestiana]STX54165.1 Beta-carotene 15,15'-dioxygenase [Legionella geestiana]